MQTVFKTEGGGMLVHLSALDIEIYRDIGKAIMALVGGADPSPRIFTTPPADPIDELNPKAVAKLDRSKPRKSAKVAPLPRGAPEANLCQQCHKPLPKGSRKTHKGECTRLYTREYARKWYQKKHGKGPARPAPAPVAQPSKLPEAIPPATRKARLDAIREANERLREQEDSFLRSGAEV